MDTFTHTTGDGAEHRFAHLTLYDVFGDPNKPEINGFVPSYRKRLKSELIDNLKTSVESGFIDKEQGLVELQNFDAHHKKRDPLKSFLEYIQESPDAAGAMVRHAYAKANDNAKLPDGLPPGFVDDVCWMLLEPFGITAKTDAPDTLPGSSSATYGDGTEDPNPKPPLTYSAT